MIVPDARTVAQAARWAAQLDSGKTSARQRQACEAWCAEHPANRLALDRMQAASSRFDQLGAVERDALKRAVEARAGTRRRAAAATLALCIVAGLGWTASRSLSVRALTPDHRTATGEQQTLSLADGSRLVLDTGGAVDVNVSGKHRTITLFEGQVLASVAPDRARPFVVRSRHGEAAALGTAFVVRSDEAQTLVTVIESRVRVCPSAGSACLDLGPGERARIDGRAVTRLSPVNPEAAAAWTKGWLEVDDRPLAEVVDELNRYRRSPIGYDARLGARVRITGSYPLTDTDRAVEAIAQTAGLRLSRSDDGRPRLSP